MRFSNSLRDETILKDKMTRNKRSNDLSGLEEFLNLLHRSKEIVTIKKIVSPKYEIAAIVSRLDKGKAVLFESIKNNKLRVTANILGTRKRIALAIGARNEDHIDERINVICFEANYTKILSGCHLEKEGQESL